MSETRNQRRIREILGENEPDKDHSLRAQAMARATEETVPRTLTPWEWEEWYASHGRPADHQQPASRAERPGFWQRLFGRRRSGEVRKNCARNPNEDAEF